MESAFGVDHGEISKLGSPPKMGAAMATGRRIGLQNVSRVKRGELPFEASSRPSGVTPRKRKAWERGYKRTGAPIAWSEGY